MREEEYERRLYDMSMLQEAKEQLVEVLVSEDHLDYATELSDEETRDFAFVTWFARRWNMPWMEEYARDIKRNRVSKVRKGRKGLEEIIKIQPPIPEQRRGILSGFRK